MPSRLSIAWQKSRVIPSGWSLADIQAMGALPPEMPTTSALAALAFASAPCAAAGVATARAGHRREGDSESRTRASSLFSAHALLLVRTSRM